MESPLRLVGVVLQTAERGIGAFDDT